MIEVKFTCDKCGTEEDTAMKVNTISYSLPDGWNTLDFKWSQYHNPVKKLFCKGCCDEYGYDRGNTTGKDLEERQSNAERLMEVMLEIMEEEGFTRGE